MSKQFDSMLRRAFMRRFYGRHEAVGAWLEPDGHPGWNRLVRHARRISKKGLKAQRLMRESRLEFARQFARQQARESEAQGWSESITTLIRESHPEWPPEIQVEVAAETMLQLLKTHGDAAYSKQPSVYFLGFVRKGLRSGEDYWLSLSAPRGEDGYTLGDQLGV